MTISFGLSSEDKESRIDSIGSSDARVIVEGNPKMVAALHRRKCKLSDIEDFEDLEDNIHAQLGHYTEEFNRYWFTRRTGCPVSRAGEMVKHPDHSFLHVSLDGFVTLNPGNMKTDDFKLTWLCPMPSKPVPCLFEAKWRIPFSYSQDFMNDKYMPQVQHGVSCLRHEGVEHAVLSTLHVPQISAVVIPFNQFYWAEMFIRLENFWASVESGEMPEVFASIEAPKPGQPGGKVLRTIDPAKEPFANEWADAAATFLENEGQAKKFETAKKAIKEMFPDDAGSAAGFGITVKRGAAGAVTIKADKPKGERRSAKNAA